MESSRRFVDPWMTAAGGFTASRAPRSSSKSTSRARPLVRSRLCTPLPCSQATERHDRSLARNSTSQKNETTLVRSLRCADPADLRICKDDLLTTPVPFIYVLVTNQSCRLICSVQWSYDERSGVKESDNAVLPFMTVPLIDTVRNGLMTRTVKHKGKAWYWTYEGLSSVPTIGNARAYSTRWVLRETAEGDPLAWVRFQMRPRDDSSSRRRRPCSRRTSERLWRSVSFVIAASLLMNRIRRSKPEQRLTLCSPSRAVPEHAAAGISTGSSRAVIDAAVAAQRSPEYGGATARRCYAWGHRDHTVTSAAVTSESRIGTFACCHGWAIRCSTKGRFGSRTSNCASRFAPAFGCYLRDSMVCAESRGSYATSPSIHQRLCSPTGRGRGEHRCRSCQA